MRSNMRATVVRERKAQHVFDAHGAEPLGVATDLQVVGSQDAADLLDVGGGVAVDLFLAEARAAWSTCPTGHRLAR